MKSAAGFRIEFLEFFVDENHHLIGRGNVGVGRTVVPLCRKILASTEPLLHSTFLEWENEKGPLLANGRPAGVHDVATSLLAVGQWEGAWLIRQLHYDQMVKHEFLARTRAHKGEPACGLAIIARAIGSPSLCRHYATLSSIGDIYWEHQLGFLKHGGYGPTMLEQFESAGDQDKFRKAVREQMMAVAGDSKRPLHLEAFLAARWFCGALGKQITNVAPVDGKVPRSFADMLLVKVEKGKGMSATTRGTYFEAAAGLLISSTPGFEVRSARQTTDEQVDLVVHYESDRLTQLRLATGAGLVECKSTEGRVSSRDLRDFGAKCLFHRVRFGVLVARSGITGRRDSLWQDKVQAELVRRRFLADGLTILVLDISQLRGKSLELRGLQDVLTADHDELMFGPVAGEQKGAYPKK